MSDNDNDDDGDNLVEVNFHSTRDDLPTQQRRTRYSGDCRHKRTSVDVPDRAVRCRDCGDVLDPFSVLAGIADDWELSQRIIDNMRGERERITREIEQLKRQRRNTQAQIRRRKQ